MHTLSSVFDVYTIYLTKVLGFRRHFFMSKGGITLILLNLILQLGISGGREIPLPEQTFQEYILTDTIPYKNRPGSNPDKDKRNPFDLKDPKSIDKDIEYDPVTGEYIFKEKIGGDYYKNPSTMSFDEYMAFKARQQDNNYLREKSGTSVVKSRFASYVDPLKKIDLKKSLTDRLFGGQGIQIEPRGNVDMTVGFNYNFNDIPTSASQFNNNKTFNPDFQMNIQLEVTASIGDKFKLNTNYNTQASFDFDNKIKLAYDSEKFTEDDIIKKIEAGNVALPLRSTLIKGSQNLFGFKTDWQFGHLKLSALLAQQRAKNENITSKGGGVFQEYTIRPDQFDENRHFFISQYNRQNYEPSLASLPEIISKFKIKVLEVWMSDDNTNIRDINVKDIVALTDLGASADQPHDMSDANFARYTAGVSPLKDARGFSLPANSSNNLLKEILKDKDARNLNKVVSRLTNEFGLQQGKDFEKVRARRLNPNDYTYNADLGFISLRIRPKPNQIVAVSYQYIYNGRDEDRVTGAEYKVGELSSEISSDTVNFNVLFTKLIKSSTQVTTLPSYDLMMKNVYSIGGYNLNQEGFTFDIFFESQDGIQRRFIPEIEGYPLLNLFRLDNLNKTSDPQPDGIFDWVTGQTVIPQSGTIVFPVLEPFGLGLKTLVKNIVPDPIKADQIYNKYQYEALYDSSITKARQKLISNQFLLKGNYKAGKSNEIPLNTFGSDQNSKIIVKAGSLVLTENLDYIVDRGAGKITILNESYLTGDAPISVDYENSSLFNIQTRSMIGLRAEYAKSKDFYIGSTYMNLFERPFTQKVGLREDPINNKVFGVDFGYTKQAPWLTRALDALPLLSTKESSKISVQGEAAYLKPGYSRAIEQTGSEGGVVYIDDFEGSSSGIGLYFNPTQWVLATVPVTGNLGTRFLGNNVVNNWFTSSNRALLSWYRVDPIARGGAPDAGNSYSRQVDERELFPNRERPVGFAQELTFDLTFYPREKGPYNYDLPNGIDNGLGNRTAGVDNDNKLNDPASRWGGIMTKLSTNDFEVSNVEYIDFWLLNPYLPKFNQSPISQPGEMYLQLGTFSEDILKDDIQQFEHGLPTPNLQLPVTNTKFGKVSRVPPIVNSFELNDRELQDLGLDGMSSNDEFAFFQNDYLNILRNSLNTGAYDSISKDPSNDDYISYRDSRFGTNSTVLERYKRNNMLEGNSQSDPNSTFPTAQTSLPDQEDLIPDKSLNTFESYYNYPVLLSQDASGNLNSKYITESITKVNNNVTETWYRFRIPITEYDFKEGPISDFRSIQSMRLLLTGFSESVTLRMVKFQLGRNTWRRDSSLCAGDNSNHLILDKIDIEENSNRLPFNYKVPPGIQRQQVFGAGTNNVLANEAGIVMRKTELLPGCTQTITRLTELDIRRYERFKMFVHAEDNKQDLKKGDLRVFVRLGKDFTQNYYEYEIPVRMLQPLTLTTPVSVTDSIWLKENEFDFPLQLLIDLKNERNLKGLPYNIPYEKFDPDKPDNIVRIVGNPNIGNVRGLVIGMRNNTTSTKFDKVEVWVNEMRLTGIENHGGFAALARAEAQMADLGNISVAGSFTSYGYGGIDERLNDRSLDDIKQVDATTSLDLGKFIPKSVNISLPFTAQYSVATRTPEFDPNDLDVKLRDKINQAITSEAKDSIKNKSIDYSSTQGFAFNNVRKNRSGNSKPRPWNIENISLSYGQSTSKKHNPIIAEDRLNIRKGALDYTFSVSPKYIQPFKFVKSKNLKFISEFNFNPIPSLFGVRNNLDRRKAVTIYRNSDPKYSTWETVKFSWLRDYSMNWDITKSLKLNFSAQVDAVVDEITYNPLRGGNVNPRTSELVSESDKKTFLLDNLKDGGRVRDYKHNITANYTLPFKYFPGLDWLQSRIQYGANYGWASGALGQADTLGSVISNGQNLTISGELNFTTLYNKIPYLKRISDETEGFSRKLNQNKSKQKTKLTDRIKDNSNKKEKEKREREITTIEKILIRPLLSLRRIQLNYSENTTTLVPGFLEKPEYLGLNRSFNAPGWKFIAGLTPDLSEGGFLDQAAAKGWISKNECFNKEIGQKKTKTFGAKGKIEIFKGFNIDLNVDRNFTRDYAETFKYEESITNPGTYSFNHLTPFEMGQYSISYISIKTLFNNNIDSLFKNFENNRKIISEQIGDKYNISNPSSQQPGYRDGFEGNHQEVIINSFVSTYSGKDPRTSNLDVFSAKPLPNWQFNYSGLSKMKFMKKVFQDISFRHGYKNVLTINSYRTNLDYKENLLGAPVARKSDSTVINSYYSKLEIPEVNVKEDFSPLIGVSVKTLSGLDLQFDWNKGRNLSLKSVNGTLEERNSSSYSLRAGYVVKNVYLSFLPGMKKVKKVKKSKKGAKPEDNAKLPKGNDLTFSLTFNYRDDINKIHQLDYGIPARANDGAKTFMITPDIKYNLNKNLNLRLFVDYSKRVPYNPTSSLKDINIRGGLTVQFLLN